MINVIKSFEHYVKSVTILEYNNYTKNSRNVLKVCIVVIIIRSKYIDIFSVLS